MHYDDKRTWIRTVKQNRRERENLCKSTLPLLGKRFVKKENPQNALVLNWPENQNDTKLVTEEYYVISL